MKNRLFAELRGIPSNVEDTRTITFILSSAKRDRHRTVLNLDGWDLSGYERNPVVFYNHMGYDSKDPDVVIGKGIVVKNYQTRTLDCSIVFEPESINPLAEKLFRKVLNGTLSALSVGFLPMDSPVGKYGVGDQSRGGKDETFFYGKRSLLEASLVNVPSNDEAVLKGLEILEPFTRGEQSSQDLRRLDAKMKLAGIIPTEKEKRKQRDLLIIDISATLAGIDLKKGKK